jgi:hypothetical protein
MKSRLTLTKISDTLSILSEKLNIKKKIIKKENNE